MTKTLVSHSPARDMDQFRHDLFPYVRDRAARARRRQERLETRQTAAQALLDMRDEALQHIAQLGLQAVIAKWVGQTITWRNIDRGQYEVTQAAKAAGLDHAARKAIKDSLFGHKCSTCGLRGCTGFCRDDVDWSYEEYLAQRDNYGHKW